MSERSRRLTLLGGFGLTAGGRPERVPAGGQRLLAFLAASEGAQRREHVAWTLWADDRESRALANLRTALWRLPRPGGRALFTDCDDDLALASDVEVDWRRRSIEAGEVLAGTRTPSPTLVHALRSDLLPSWYEEWLAPHREQFRQLRLHALEAACHALLAAGSTFDALCAGLAAVACEPLRESAHRCVIAAHLAEGNTSEATRQCDAYLELLGDAGLRPRPSDALWALFADPSIAKVERAAATPS